MVRWNELSPSEMTLLDHVFWSSGISREALATASAFSKSRANAAVAGMLEQGVLEPTGETFARHVMRRRLEACRRALEHPASAHRSVTDIALGWGFSSLATFYRAFRSAYGVAPGDIRETCAIRTDYAPLSTERDADLPFRP